MTRYNTLGDMLDKVKKKNDISRMGEAVSALVVRLEELEDHRDNILEERDETQRCLNVVMQRIDGIAAAIAVLRGE
jgi:hypothetical protein